MSYSDPSSTNTNFRSNSNLNPKTFSSAPQTQVWFSTKVTSSGTPDSKIQSNLTYDKVVIGSSGGTNDQDLYVYGDINYTGSLTNISDSRLKKDIIKMTDNEDIKDNILKLNPVSFRYNYDTDHKIHFGFITQEVEDVFPQLVTETQTDLLEDKTQVLNTMEMIPILVNKIQKMSEEITEIQKENKLLKIELLETKMAFVNKIDKNQINIERELQTMNYKLRKT
jgi:hypothetical protein